LPHYPWPIASLIYGDLWIGGREGSLSLAHHAFNNLADRVLYIIEKRATIRKISSYIKNKIEMESDVLSWETYSRQNRSTTPDKSNSQENEISLPTVSPLKIEFSLLILTNLINTIWLWLSNNFKMALFATLLSVFSVAWSGFIVTKYYTSRQH
jgi:hypothetical protein